MQAKLILLVLLTIITFSPISARADNFENMSDEALASYISGRLNEALKNSDYKIKEYCDESGCSIVVQ